MTGGSKATATATSAIKAPEGFVTDTAIATVSTSGGLAGLAAGGVGAFIAATIQVLRDIFRHEKPYGEQGSDAGGVGTVTNKTETKMHQMRTLAEGKTNSADDVEQPQRILPPNEEYVDSQGITHKISFAYDNNHLIKYDEASNGVIKNYFYDNENHLKAVYESADNENGYTEVLYDGDGNKKAYGIEDEQGFTTYYDENNNAINANKFEEIYDKLLE